MRHASDMGMNRTGIGMAPGMSEEMIKGAREFTHPTGDSGMLSSMRKTLGEGATSMGSTPPPPSAKGWAQSGVEMLKGNKPTVLMDKLGERLAFERTGTRLYEALLTKFELEGTWEGGPTREELQRFHDEEAQHFRIAKEAIESLGGDPTAMTPSADVAGVAGEGIGKVISDPRSTMADALHAIHMAELTDNDGWEMLIALTEALGQDKLLGGFRKALEEEQVHLQKVREWLSIEAEQEARRELEEKAPG